MKHLRSLKSLETHRRGLAAVEFALCLPLLMILVFGSIEASNAIYLRQAMTIATYEAAQIASGVGGTDATAIQRANEILATYNIAGASVDVSPSITAATESGTAIKVTIGAPSNSNSIGPNWFFKDTTYTREFTMNRL